MNWALNLGWMFYHIRSQKSPDNFYIFSVSHFQEILKFFNFQDNPNLTTSFVLKYFTEAT